MDVEKFGKHLRKLRSKEGLTQKEFGEKLGVSVQAVSKWEVGRCMPDITTLHEISKLLNININDLLEGNDNLEQKNSKKNKKLWLALIAFLIMIIMVLGLFYYRHEHSGFEVKMISTTCKDFNLEGIAAYDHQKTSIFITKVDYCGKENNDVYKKINCNLYENYNDTATLVSSCDVVGKNTTLEEFLKDVEINVTDYSAACKKFVESHLSIHITAVQDDGKNILYDIPIAFEDNC